MSQHQLPGDIESASLSKTESIVKEEAARMNELMIRLSMHVKPVNAEVRNEYKEEESALDDFLSRVQRTCHELTLKLDLAESGMLVGKGCVMNEVCLFLDGMN